MCSEFLHSSGRSQKIGDGDASVSGQIASVQLPPRDGYLVLVALLIYSHASHTASATNPDDSWRRAASMDWRGQGNWQANSCVITFYELDTRLSYDVLDRGLRDFIVKRRTLHLSRGHTDNHQCPEILSTHGTDRSREHSRLKFR